MIIETIKPIEISRRQNIFITLGGSIFFLKQIQTALTIKKKMIYWSTSKLRTLKDIVKKLIKKKKQRGLRYKKFNYTIRGLVSRVYGEFLP